MYDALSGIFFMISRLTFVDLLVCPNCEGGTERPKSREQRKEAKSQEAESRSCKSSIRVRATSVDTKV